MIVLRLYSVADKLQKFCNSPKSNISHSFSDSLHYCNIISISYDTFDKNNGRSYYGYSS